MEWVGPVGGVSADWDPGATLQTALGSASTRSAAALPQSANTPPTFCVRIRSLEEKVTNLNQDLTSRLFNIWFRPSALKFESPYIDFYNEGR